MKPSRLGSSVGISRVERSEELDEAVELALRHDPRVIVEASARGREVECSVLGNEEPETSLPGEIVAHAEWYDFEAKYTEGGMELRVPAPIDAEQRRPACASWPPRSSRLAGCSGLARCDFFVEPDGEVLVNEINTMPGFTETSVYAKLFEASGIALPGPLRPPRRRSRSSATRAPAPTSSEPVLRGGALFDQLDVADLDLVAACLVARRRRPW